MTNRLRLLSVVFALSFSHVSAQDTLHVHDRIGSTLDSEERAYFGLFPDIQAFRSATFVATGDSTEVHIYTDGSSDAPDSVIALVPSQVEALRTYIATFEHHPSAFHHPGWQAMVRSSRQFADPAVPIPYVDADEAKAWVIADEKRFEGIVLAASDTLLLLHSPAHPYNWRTPALHAFDPSDVHSVRLATRRSERRTSQFTQLAAIGAGLLLAQPLFLDLGEGDRRYGGTGALAAGAALGYGVG